MLTLTSIKCWHVNWESAGFWKTPVNSYLRLQNLEYLNFYGTSSGDFCLIHIIIIIHTLIWDPHRELAFTG